MLPLMPPGCRLTARAARSPGAARSPRAARVALGASVLLIAAGCSAAPGATPPVVPGTAGDPREVVIVARDYAFVPAVVDLVPGEIVTFQVVNGGLVTHEAIVGPMSVQDAWEAAEAPTVSAPPGPTARVSVPPELAGLRVVVGSGERRDAAWTVPASAPADGGWFVGCHIPGHWAQGMVVPVRFVGPDGVPLPTAPRAAAPGNPTRPGDTLRAPVRAG